MSGSVPPCLCSGGNDLSSGDDSASALELSKFAVSGVTITVDTVEVTDISIKELDDDIMSYADKGNEDNIDSPVEYVGLLNCYPEPLSIVAEEKAKNKATAIKNWRSKLSQYCQSYS